MDLNQQIPNKPDDYFSAFRQEIFPLLPSHSGRVLDLGCGSGETSSQLKKMGKCDWVCGIEGQKEISLAARNKLDSVIHTNLDQFDFVFDEPFDLVLALDILEHLVDPWSAVKKVHGLLRPGGVFLVSLPNVRHLRVLLPLLFKGDWRYQTEGILDSTHLRFFTLKTAKELLESAGFKIKNIDHTGAKQGLSRWANWLTFGAFKEFFILQNLIACEKPLE